MNRSSAPSVMDMRLSTSEQILNGLPQQALTKYGGNMLLPHKYTHFTFRRNYHQRWQAFSTHFAM